MDDIDIRQAAESDCDTILDMLTRLAAELKAMASRWAELAMLSRTHGQPASPTTLGKEIANFAHRLRRQQSSLSGL